MDVTKVGKTIVHFVYDNGVIETNTLVLESDRELKCNKRIIAKSTEHAKIDAKGRKHYFVHGHENSTSVPFRYGMDKAHRAKTKPIEREAVFHVMQASLLKSLVSAQTMPIFTMFLLVLSGVGVGYVIGSEWGNPEITTVNDTDNYYQDTDKDNGTVVITGMMLMDNFDSSIFSYGVFTWKNT